MFQVVSDGDGAVLFANFFNTFWPDAVSQVRPIVVAFFQFFPAGLKVLLPFGKPKQFPQGAGGNNDTVVEVGLPGQLNDALNLSAEIRQFPFQIQQFFQAVTVIP